MIARMGGEIQIGVILGGQQIVVDYVTRVFYDETPFPFCCSTYTTQGVVKMAILSHIAIDRELYYS